MKPLPPHQSRSTLTEAHRLVLPSGIVATDGPAVIALAAKVGMGLDPWQQDIARLVFARLADGGFASDTVAMSIPRQAGKTYLVSAMVFAWCLKHPGVTVAWTAHHNKVMLETFQSLRQAAAKELLLPHVSKVNASAENRSIVFANGSRIVMAARESGALRGVAKVSILVLDEAQILTDNAMSDMLPTQNQAEHPLTIMLGTPPRPKDPGEVFTQQREQAIAAEKAGTHLELATWIEFSADEDAETDDTAQLRKANPSYPKRTPLRSVRKLRRSLTEDHFRREALGIWDDKSTPSVIAPAIWASQLDANSKAVKKLVLAIDVNPDRTAASVALAGMREDGLAHIELDQQGEGVGWIADWVASRCEKNQISAVIVDAKGPAVSLVPDLRRRIKTRIITTSTEEMTSACADLVDAVSAGEVWHTGQPQLTESLNSARKRSVGDRWAWNRKSNDSDITAIVAATLALWGALSRRVRDVGEKRRTGGGALW